MNTPRLRFKDLGEINYPEWEWKKIEDCCLLIKDGTHGTHKDVIAGIPLLSAKDIYENSVHIPFDARKISEHDYKKIYSKYELKKEDVLITIVGTLGRTAIIDSNTPRIAFQRSVAVMRPSTQLITAKYLNYVCNSHNFQNEIEIRKKKGAQPGIYLGELSSISIPVPSLPEQQKIADFLSTYDEKIRLQRERVETLERRKKGLLQKVFSQEIRFKAEDGNEFPEWGKKKIEEICSHFKSGKYISASDILPMGIYPVYGGNGIRGYANHFNHNGDYIVIGRQGALCGNVRRISGLNYCTEHAIAVQANSDNCTFFLEYLFIVMRLGQYSDQGAQPGLAVNKLVKLETEVPCLKEQEKIATFFTAIDDQINIERERLSTMETIKKGLLQGLFC